MDLMGSWSWILTISSVTQAPHLVTVTDALPSPPAIITVPEVSPVICHLVVNDEQ